MADKNEDRRSSRDYEALKVARETAAKNARAKRQRIEQLHARRSERQSNAAPTSASAAAAGQ
jgi:hypothetical protein